MTISNVLLEQLAELEAVHAQHHHVADDEVRLELRQVGYGIGGAMLSDHAIGAAQDETQEVEHLGLIIDHQHYGYRFIVIKLGAKMGLFSLLSKFLVTFLITIMQS